MLISNSQIEKSYYILIVSLFVFILAWEGSSVWDLPLDSMPQASSIEQMQLEKAKALKVRKIRVVM